MRRLVPLAVRGLALAAALLAGREPASAQPISRDDLPPSLRPWVPWVLDQLPTLGCPTVHATPVCLWPGQLRLELGATGGSLQLDLVADRAADVRLPGSSDAWPQDVRVDGAPAPVFDKDGGPRVRVAAGHHRLSGRFAWSRLPESLTVPAEIGLVDLRLDGQAIARPRRDEAGLLWLRAGVESHGEGESLRLQVFRQIRDGIPLFVETRLQLEVAGRAREITLPASAAAGNGGRCRLGRPARARRERRGPRAGPRRALFGERGRARRRPSEGARAPEGAAEGPVAVARGLGLRRGRSAPTGRALRPDADRSLAHRAARGVARAAGVPRRARREPRHRRGEARRGRAAARPAEPPARALARSRGRRAQRARPLRRGAPRHDAPRPAAAGNARPHRHRRPGPARHRASRDEGRRRRAAPLEPPARGRLAPCVEGRAAGRRLDDGRRAARSDPPPPAGLEPARHDRRRPGPRHLDLALVAPRILLRPDRDARRPAPVRNEARAPRARGPRPHARRVGRAVRRLAEPRGRDRAPARRARRPLPAARASVVPRERRRAGRRGRAVRARPGARSALPAGRGGRCRTANDRRRRAPDARGRSEFPDARRAGRGRRRRRGRRAGADRTRRSSSASRGGQDPGDSRGRSATLRLGARARFSLPRRSRSPASPTTSPWSRTRRPSCRRVPAFPAGPGRATRSPGADRWAATTRCGSCSPRPASIAS